MTRHVLILPDRHEMSTYFMIISIYALNNLFFCALKHEANKQYILC
ncbi:MAG: hypothetical protein HAW62_02290 [Endozoicomonadaceae bacterium]|nr:hypothetical protein [Endozoicomonadaceae bacterium]